MAAVLTSTKEYPFDDIIWSVSVAEMFAGKENQEGLKSFYQLTLVALQWVENKIDELIDLLKRQYKGKKMADFQGLKPLQLSVPRKDEMYKKRD